MNPCSAACLASSLGKCTIILQNLIFKQTCSVTDVPLVLCFCRQGRKTQEFVISFRIISYLVQSEPRTWDDPLHSLRTVCRTRKMNAWNKPVNIFASLNTTQIGIQTQVILFSLHTVAAALVSPAHYVNTEGAERRECVCGTEKNTHRSFRIHV